MNKLIICCLLIVSKVFVKFRYEVEIKSSKIWSCRIRYHYVLYVMQFNVKLLFQLRELLLKIQYCLIKVILIFNLQFIPY